MKTKKLTFSALMIAIGIIAGNLIYIPVGISKCFPVQHIINILTAVALGPAYSVSIAFAISLLRNMLGTGSLLAFPGSMIGAFLAGYIYKKTNKNLYAILGEVVGTGILGALAAYPIAKFIIGKDVAVFFFMIPFSISTIGGSIIAYLLLKVNENVKILKNFGIK
ncbi:thiamine-precursor transporter protein ThiW [Clostridium acetireducens DSM 10703]|jgi:energy coupling factor transporter S component ThiW|uniref:Thiamine-precursor transporter protein ThiW n=1 Tax=Clostridium acetireducens DSM 10703 TaxID=1121290 RepID=A0A1E8F027_9CLOT|nr:energy coupling factor transporter S component ThiW [Clostridium acetireducens]OFI06788.1 thiamine-precursor transporter protein ThiW [Clostridium acetireducens DSM 10703]